MLLPIKALKIWMTQLWPNAFSHPQAIWVGNYARSPAVRIFVENERKKKIFKMGRPLRSVAKKIGENPDIQQQLKVAEERAKLALQVCHDIRSPLCALRVLLNKSKGLKGIERRMVESCCQRIETIAEDLLKLNQLEKNLKASELKPFISEKITDLNSMIESIIREKDLEYSQIKFEVQKLSEPQIQIQFPPEKLARILSNLINNSVEAGASHIKLSWDQVGAEIKIKVKDNGSGMDEMTRNQILKGESISHKTCGHGLGLLYAQETLKIFNGLLLINNDLPQGTEVCLTLRTRGDQTLPVAR